MPRMTDAQVRNAREQALRAVRRKQRSLDTAVEVMERRLDRAILNKERITLVLARSVITDYKNIILRLREMEAFVADMAVIFQSTGGWGARIPGKPMRLRPQ